LLIEFEKEQYCARCGTVAKPKRYRKGSFLLETVLWGFAGLAGFLGLFNLFYFVVAAVPLLFAMAYSLWRRGLVTPYIGCPACRRPGMFPVDSPVARRALGQRRQ